MSSYTEPRASGTGQSQAQLLLFFWENVQDIVTTRICSIIILLPLELKQRMIMILQPSNALALYATRTCCSMLQF